ncbi:MAG: hypothetical protein IKT58_03225 [Oscillospiraceae bacterium]|nr:hypothetical protein [Oscillospiraceae bacterium]
MKRITIALLVLCLCLICFGCDASQPTIRYENSMAYYTQKGASYTMELQFDEPVTEGSTITLLLEGEEVLGFTAEGEFTRLRLSSVKLELNKPYSLEINGVIQCHGKGRVTVEENDPGYIPDPTTVTIPQEPMMEVEITVATTAETTPTEETSENDSPFGTPPTIAEEGITIGSITPTQESTVSGSLNSDGTLNSKPLNEDKVSGDNQSLQTSIEVGGTVFTLTNTVTGFASVRNAT